MQRVISKLVDQTSASATQISITLPATSIKPTAATGTTGVSMSHLDGLIIVAVTNAAVALTQGVTVFTQDAAATVNAEVVNFSIPTASTTAQAYYVGPGFGTNDGVPANGGFGFGACFLDQVTIQATPGAASTVRLVVYAVRHI